MVDSLQLIVDSGRFTVNGEIQTVHRKLLTVNQNVTLLQTCLRSIYILQKYLTLYIE